MKTLKSILVGAILTFTFSGFAFAEEKPAGKPAGCCAKASADGKACTHSCCAEAAKANKNCEKCGGANEKKS